MTTTSPARLCVVVDVEEVDVDAGRRAVGVDFDLQRRADPGVVVAGNVQRANRIAGRDRAIAVQVARDRARAAESGAAVDRRVARDRAVDDERAGGNGRVAGVRVVARRARANRRLFC